MRPGDYGNRCKKHPACSIRTPSRESYGRWCLHLPLSSAFHFVLFPTKIVFAHQTGLSTRTKTLALLLPPSYNMFPKPCLTCLAKRFHLRRQTEDIDLDLCHQYKHTIHGTKICPNQSLDTITCVAILPDMVQDMSKQIPRHDNLCCHLARRKSWRTCCSRLSTRRAASPPRGSTSGRGEIPVAASPCSPKSEPFR